MSVTDLPSTNQKLLEESTQTLFVRQRLSLPGIGVMFATLLFAFRHVDSDMLLFWGLSVALATLSHLFCIHSYFRRKEALSPRWWLRLFQLSSAFQGLTLGLGGYLFLDFNNGMQIVLVTLFLVAPIYGSTVFAAACFPVHAIWSVTTTVPLAIVLVQSGIDEMVLLGTSLLMVGIPSALVLGWVLSREFRASLKTRLEKEELIRELRLQKQLAEQANQDKSRFLAAISHDLRQPLHALDLFHSSLKYRLDQEEQQKLLGLASQSSHTLGEMLGELMDIARLDAGKVEAEQQIVSLTPLLEECAGEMRPMAMEKGLEFRQRLSYSGCVETDPVLFNRILRNLLSNAICYTEQGGVLLGVRQRGGRVRIEVHDTGPGINKDQLEHVFDEFYQVDNPERDREKGLGLGLAIVKRLSVALDHTLTIRSRPGRGSCFAIEMPQCEVDSMRVKNDAMFMTGPTDISGIFIVVVDDDRAILQGVRELLRSWGCEMLLAESEAELLTELKMHDYPVPDVLISDYRLRHARTGLQVVEAVRGHFRVAIPALIISGDVHPEVQAEVKGFGCSWLEKPVHDEALRQILAELSQQAN